MPPVPTMSQRRNSTDAAVGRVFSQGATLSLAEEMTSPVSRQTVDLQSEEAQQLQASFAALDVEQRGSNAKQAKLSALKAALKGRTTFKDRYQLEPGSQEQGGSAVVVFAFDMLSK